MGGSVRVKSITGGIEPQSPRGAVWPYVLALPTVTYYSDELASLVEIFIPGYTDIQKSADIGFNMTVDRQAFILNTSLIEYAGQEQNRLVDVAIKQGVLKFTQPPNEVQRVLTRSRSLPFDGLISEDTLDYHWDHVVPLILFATDYHPYADRPRPTGHSIIFLDASSERAFLDSMSVLGFCRFFVRR